MSYLPNFNGAAESAVHAPDAQPHGGDLATSTILARVDQLAVLPHVVFKVLELSGSTDSAASEMEKAIIVDPAFSAKLLTHANSSFYGLSRKVTSIRDAAVYMGFKAVREMALTVGTFDMFVGKNDSTSLRRRSWWRHSIDTAISCRVIAEHTKALDPAEAYTCGLLHYIGKSLLDRFGGHDYSAVEQKLAEGGEDRAAEVAVYGCDHQDLGFAAGNKWGLPPQIVASFRYSERNEEEEYGAYGACVCLGSLIANLAVDGSGTGEHLPSWALDELKINPVGAKDLYDLAVERLASAAQTQIS